MSKLSDRPCNPYVYAIRPLATLVVEPVRCSPSSSGTSHPAPYPEAITPAKTAVRVPFNPSGSILASSKASHDASSNWRCWGSIANAS